jgi:protein kinase A
MDLINKGVQLIRRSTLTKKHQRSQSQGSNKASASSPPSPTMSKTPSITSSITSDEGSCYSSGFNNLQTPGRNSTSNLSHHIPTSITITPMISSPPQSPVNNKNNFKGIISN